MQLGAAQQVTSVAALVGRPAVPPGERMRAGHVVEGAVCWGQVRCAEGQASRGEGGGFDVEVLRDREGRALLDRRRRHIREGQLGGVGVAGGHLQGQAGSHGKGPVDGDGHLQPQVQHNPSAACVPPTLGCHGLSPRLHPRPVMQPAGGHSRSDPTVTQNSSRSR